MLATSLGLDTLQAGIHLYYNAGLLRGISTQLSNLVLIAAATGTLITCRFGAPLRALYKAEREADANFRYSLTRMRENAESIAFYQGEDQEVLAVSERLGRKQATEWDRFALKDVVQAVSQAYRQVVGLLPAFLLAGAAEASTGLEAGGGTGGQGHADSGHGHGHGHGPRGGGGEGGGGGTNVGLLNQARESFEEVLYHLLLLAENVSNF